MTALGTFCCSLLSMIGFQGLSQWTEQCSIWKSISKEYPLRQVKEKVESNNAFSWPEDDSWVNKLKASKMCQIKMKGVNCLFTELSFLQYHKREESRLCTPSKCPLLSSRLPSNITNRVDPWLSEKGKNQRLESSTVTVNWGVSYSAPRLETVSLILALFFINTTIWRRNMYFVLKQSMTLRYERSYRSSSEEGKVKSLRIRVLSHKLIARCHSVHYLPSSYICVMRLTDSQGFFLY